MPHKGKRPTSNQHDRRHESGLAAPGKRISRQRSIGNINGVVLGNVRVGASPAQPAVAPTNNGTTAFSSATDEGLRYARTKATVTAPAGAPVNPAGSGRTISNASSDTQATPLRRLRQPDTRAATLPDCQEPSSAVRILLRGRGLGAVVNTILTTCPLRDVLALLIILLQLPPMLLMLIQLLYAILTSLPPVPSSTVSAISEFLSGSVGVSSMTAVIGIDLVIFGIWLLLQLPARNVLLDCSQAVIAMTLGGATASVADATYGWSLCTFVILFSYVFRSASFRRHSLQLLSRQFSSIAMVHSDSLLLDEPIDKLYSSHSWPGVLLGIHILAQGLTRAVRRNLHFRAADKIKSRAATADYELSSTSETPRSQSVGSDLELDRFSQDSDDTDYYLSRTANDINVKARRTKDNEQHVRKHQPLWAALANTKISVLKAVDRGGVTFDAIRANTAGPNSVGSMDFLTDEEQVWFTEISTMGAAFEACLRYEDGGGQRNIDEEALGDPRGRAKRTPFFIRVNGTEWMSSRAQLVEVKGDEKRCGIWAGEILGLAAQSSYDCEFLRSADGRVIYQLKITTPTVSSSDQGMLVVQQRLYCATNNSLSSSRETGGNLRADTPHLPRLHPKHLRDSDGESAH